MPFILTSYYVKLCTQIGFKLQNSPYLFQGGEVCKYLNISTAQTALSYRDSLEMKTWKQNVPKGG
jgi:hypothetical protein